jgi:hypothetical protein
LLDRGVLTLQDPSVPNNVTLKDWKHEEGIYLDRAAGGHRDYAVLMTILMPSLQIARDQAPRVYCLSDVRTLTLAWLMYKDDNNDNLVHSGTSSIRWVDEPPEGATLEQQKEAICQVCSTVTWARRRMLTTVPQTEEYKVCRLPF